MIVRIASLLQDVRYVFRQIRRSPGFATTIVLTVGLAVGANTALFSLIDGVMLHPLHYPHPERVVLLWTGDPAHGQLYSMSYPQFELFRERAKSLDVAAYDDESVTWSSGGDPERIEGGRVSREYFPLLGAQPALGRNFSAEEDSPGGPPVAMISYSAWVNRYHRDPAVVGKPISIDRLPFTIIGVAAKDFDFLGENVEVWRPRTFETRSYAAGAVRLGETYLTLIARLKPGVSLEEARAEVAVIDAADQRERPRKSDARDAIQIDLLEHQVFNNVRSGLWVLWGAVICVLLIACANVANLMMSRAWTRRSEIAARVALGASYGRITQQLLAESLVLTMLGGLIALPVARSLLVWLVGLVRETTPQVPDVHLNPSVMFLALAVCAMVGVLFGLAPVALLTRGISGGLIGKERSVTESRAAKASRSAFVTVQIALSIVLLAGAGLLVRSFYAMRAAPTGLRPDRVIVQPLTLMEERYDKNEARNAFYNEALRRIQSLPGVESAAISSRVTLVHSGLGYEIHVAGRPEAPGHADTARARSVSAEYFDMLGVPIVAGRNFNAHDTANSQRVMLVNEKFAREYFPGANSAQNALGKLVTYSTDAVTCQIVGVVRDVRVAVASTDVNEEIYLPLEQRPLLGAYLVVRAAGDPYALTPEIRSELQKIDPEQAVHDSRTLNWMIDHRFARPQNTLTALGAFAATALLLAALGIYGLQAYSVAQRSREIGIRMALGATPVKVLLAVLGDSARLAAIGLAVGWPAAFVLARVYASLLFQVTPGDPLTMAAVLAGLATLVIGSTYLPARRASRVDPAIVLRGE